MSQPNHNSFTDSTISEHTWRLMMIQNNRTETISLISPPAAVQTWMLTCSSSWETLLNTLNLERSQADTAVAALKEKVDVMDDLYVDARETGLANYEDDVSVREFKFYHAYPEARDEKLARVKLVIDTHAIHVAAGVTHLIDDDIITELTAAYADVQAAVIALGTEVHQEGGAYTALMKRMEADVPWLRKLLARWRRKRGRNDHQISIIGCVNTNPGGGQNVPPPVAPVITVVNNTLEMMFPQPVSSVRVFSSPTGADGTWTQMYQGDNVPIPIAEVTGVMFFKGQGRNVGGWGAEAVKTVVGTLSSPAWVVYTGGAIDIAPVAGAETYEICYGPVGSTPDDPTTIQVSDANVTHYVWSGPGVGSYSFFVRAKAGAAVSPWIIVTLTFS